MHRTGACDPDPRDPCAGPNGPAAAKRAPCVLRYSVAPCGIRCLRSLRFLGKMCAPMRTHITAAAIAVACAVVWTAARDRVAGQNVQVPIFEYDPTFPKPLPETWAIGPIGGLAVDRQDHLYVVQRPGGLPHQRALLRRRRHAAQGGLLHPGATGARVRSEPARWCTRGAGPGAGYDWPQTEHGVFVDHKDIVWLAGSGAKDAQLLKFTREGKFLQQFGKPGHERWQRRHEEHGPAGQPHRRSGHRTRSTSPTATATAASSCSTATRSRSSGCGAPTATSRTTRRSVPTIPMRRRRSSSACRTTSPSRATASSTWPTGRTTASRCSARTAPT